MHRCPFCRVLFLTSTTSDCSQVNWSSLYCLHLSSTSFYIMKRRSATLNWLAVAHGITGSMSLRTFRMSFGVDLATMRLIWSYVAFYFRTPRLTPIHLLWFLYFIKTAPSSLDVAAAALSTSTPTLRKYIRLVARIVSRALPRVSSRADISHHMLIQYLLQMRFKDRWINWDHLVPSCMIDTFAAPIQEPYLEPWEYFNTKLKCCGLVYEVVLSFGTRKIISLKGPFKGKMNDKTLCEIFTMFWDMVPGEKAMADKAYFNERIFLFPHRGRQFRMSREQREFNYKIYRIRQSVERVIRRMTSFRMLKTQWRYDFEFHGDCTFAIAKIVNLSLIFEPLDRPWP